jgi:carboxyl-terminal processing protease
VGGAVAVAYVLGVLTGMVGSGPVLPGATASSVTSVVDEARTLIETTAVNPATSADLTAAAIAAMVRKTGDGWGRYIPPGETAAFEDGIDGRYSGIGAWLASTPDGGVSITAIAAGSPASEAGLARHDEVVAVDGRTIEGASATRVADLLRGEPGTIADVSVRRGTSIRTFSIQRGETGAVAVVVTRPAPGIASFAIRAFTRGVGRQLREAIASAATPVDGIILDLRGNGGGLLAEAVDVASVFLDGGRVVSYATRDEGDHILDALGEGDVRTPLVVLVDGSTASAAEVVAAALQDRGRAAIVGAQTFGKGTVQAHYHLSDGGLLELTVARYVTPAGRVIDGLGVTPDIAVSTTGAQAQARALEVLRGLSASVGDQG